MTLSRWPYLEPEHQQLLKQIVEAWRNVPVQSRQKVMVRWTVNNPHPELVHDGLSGGTLLAPLSNLEMLDRAGLVVFHHDGYGNGQLAPTPEATQYYRDLQEGVASSAARLDDVLRRRMIATTFQSDFPRAFKKWSEAEKLLWVAESSTQGTTVGHLVREALQLFADELVTITETANADPNPTRTKNRIAAVIEHVNDHLGTGDKKLCDAILDYVDGLNEIVQRQEHGSLKGGSALVWDDARRVVLHACILMDEINRIVTRTRSS